MDDRFVLKIPGKAYHLVCSHDVSSVPREENWPEPELRSIGKGCRAYYLVTMLEAELIRTHIEDYGLGWFADKETKADARYLIQVADAVDRQMSLRRYPYD